MKKMAAGLFFFCGFIIICFALFQIFSGEKAVKDTLEHAEKLVEQGQINKPNVETNIEEKNKKPQVEASQLVQKKTYEKNEIIGVLQVPKINEKFPIVEGTDDDDLKKGVGHYTGTALPREDEQIVLSGHRETVFRNFKHLEIGDTFIVKLSYGSFEYEIRDTEIVSADDRTVIRPRGEEVLTVTTCYPFNFIGNAPDRFIFYAYPVDEGNEF